MPVTSVVVPTPPSTPEPELPAVAAKAKPLMRAIPLKRLGLTPKDLEKDPVLTGLIAATETDSAYRRQKVRKALIAYLARPYRKMRARHFWEDIQDFDSEVQDWMIRSMIAFWIGDPEPT